MASIAIAGESGSGKTTSAETLDPKTTFYIDCDKKGLSWKGWRTQYNAANKNYVVTDLQDVALLCLKKINTEPEYKHVKTVVIDTINGLMVADEMRRSRDKGYDKWMDLATAVYDLIDYSLTVREDLVVVFICHTQTDHDDNGYLFTRIKTSGKKLDKICLESKFSIVLLSKCLDGEYVFETQNNNSTAKSPKGMFESKTIPNDLKVVVDAVREF